MILETRNNMRGGCHGFIVYNSETKEFILKAGAKRCESATNSHTPKLNEDALFVSNILQFDIKSKHISALTAIVQKTNCGLNGIYACNSSVAYKDISEEAIKIVSDHYVSVKNIEWKRKRSELYSLKIPVQIIGLNHREIYYDTGLKCFIINEVWKRFERTNMDIRLHSKAKNIQELLKQVTNGKINDTSKVVIRGTNVTIEQYLNRGVNMSIEIEELDIQTRILVYTLLTKEYGKPSESNVIEFVDNFYKDIKEGNFYVKPYTVEKLKEALGNKACKDTGNKEFYSYVSTLKINTEDELSQAIYKYDGKAVGEKVSVIKVDTDIVDLDWMMKYAMEEYDGEVEMHTLGFKINADNKVIITDKNGSVYGIGKVKLLAEVGDGPFIFHKLASDPLEYTKAGTIALIKLENSLTRKDNKHISVNSYEYITEVQKSQIEKELGSEI